MSWQRDKDTAWKRYVSRITEAEVLVIRVVQTMRDNDVRLRDSIPLISEPLRVRVEVVRREVLDILSMARQIGEQLRQTDVSADLSREQRRQIELSIRRVTTLHHRAEISALSAARFLEAAQNQ
jgi:hypothetical protein